MSKKSYKEIISSLERQNYKFDYYNSESVGNYLPEDADWNYRGIRTGGIDVRQREKAQKV